MKKNQTNSKEGIAIVLNEFSKKLEELNIKYQNRFRDLVKAFHELEIDKKRELAEIIAEMQFKSSSIVHEINNNIFEKDSDSRPLQFLKWGVTHASWKDLITVADIWTKIEKLEISGKLHTLDPCIIDWPSNIEIGQTFTISGRNFGQTTGIVQLLWSLGPDGLLKARIYDWSDTAIKCIIQDSNIAIPFGNTAFIEVINTKDSLNNHWQIAEIMTTITPISSVCFSEDQFTDNGNYSPWIWRSFDYTRDYYSAILPESFQPWNHPLNTNEFCNVGFMTSHGQLDHSATYVINEGPVYVREQNVYKMNITIHDDFMWSFLICVTYYIRVPKGFAIPPGWTNLSDV